MNQIGIPMKGGLVTLTKGMIASCASKKIGWPRSVVELLGADWPLHTGWKRKLVGTCIPRNNWLKLTGRKEWADARCLDKLAEAHGHKPLDVYEQMTIRQGEKTFVVSRTF